MVFKTRFSPGKGRYHGEIDKAEGVEECRAGRDGVLRLSVSTMLCQIVFLDSLPGCLRLHLLDMASSDWFERSKGQGFLT